MRFLQRIPRFLRGAAVLGGLVIGPSVAAYGQTSYCGLCCAGCLPYAIVNPCDVTCPCYVGFPPSNGNSIYIYSCADGFYGCCSCCSSA